MKDEQDDQSKNNVESGRDSAQVLVIVIDRSRLLELGNQAQNCDQGEVASEKS